MKKINEMKIGDAVISPKNGKGTITDKTKRTITVTFLNGAIIKKTYKYSDDYFYMSDF